MTPAEMRERKRLIIRRRMRGIRDQYNMPMLGKEVEHRLSDMLVDVLGEEGVPDADLRVIYKLAARGLLDTVVKQWLTTGG